VELSPVDLRILYAERLRDPFDRCRAGQGFAVVRAFSKETLINAGKAKDIKIDSSPSLRYGSE
jgi:hypothetical protein